MSTEDPTVISQDSRIYVLAKMIATESAKAFNPSYYAEPFEPHEWCIHAVMNGILNSPAYIEMMRQDAEQEKADANG